MSSSFRHGRRGSGSVRRTVVTGAAALACLGGGLATAVAASADRQPRIATIPTLTNAPDAAPMSAPSGYTAPSNDGLGVAPGKIKHVWLIIMENKSYDASFSGLNNNTYLWQTLPKQGVLLQNYYGTGHFSLDNYISLVSGQGPQPDDQSDCPDYSLINGSVVGGSLSASNPNAGQLAVSGGPEQAPGQNGCVYPSSVTTLFNQLDKAGVSWKGYAQDLGNPDASGGTHDAGTQYCGAPYAQALPAPDTTQPNPGAANSTDQYVPKHFPFPWFESILQSGDCNAQHIASLFDPSNGLYHDLQSESTTPAFSWITPNNCSDAHDAVCAGNNLSGGFSDPNTPNPPTNYTGGLYAGDLFLEHIIPEIEASAAFRDGGLIDVTFDEAFPPFTYTGNSFQNSTLIAPTASASVVSDSAGETLFGQGIHYEPAGPNTPLVTDQNGQQLSPGPGDNSFLDRPSAGTIAGTDLEACTSTANLSMGQCVLGGGSATPGSRTDSGASAASGSSTINDNAISILDEGRSVSGTGIPAGAFVGQVTETPVTATATRSNGGTVDTGSFTLVDSTGAPLNTTAAVSGITLGAESAASDPLYDAYDPTTGGGDTGSILISPYIRPGTVSDVYYNHYSWLRTMEDLFNVGAASPGLDGQGHIGYAAQPGLAPFGPDVFTCPSGDQSNCSGASGATTVTNTTTTTVGRVECVVPGVKGDSLRFARTLLDAAQCRVGKVRKPKRVRRGFHPVVASTSIRAHSIRSRGTKVNLVLKAVR
jgi:hypothetical protein